MLKAVVATTKRFFPFTLKSASNLSLYLSHDSEWYIPRMQSSGFLDEGGLKADVPNFCIKWFTSDATSFMVLQNKIVFGVLTPSVRHIVISQSSFVSASFLVVLTTLILRLSRFGLIKRLQVLAFNRRLETMTSLVCSSAVPVKANTGVPEKMKKRNQFYSLCAYQRQAGTGGGGGGERETWHRAGTWHFPKNCCKIP